MSRPGEAPDVRTVLDWLEGRLPRAVADDVARAVAEGDDELRATVDWLRDFLETTDQHRLESAPDAVVRRLGQSFRQWSAGAGRAAKQGRRAEASLVFDSRREPPRSAVRSGAGPTGAGYQLAYTSEVGEVVLDVASLRPGQVRVDGQVLAISQTAPPFVGELSCADRTVRSSRGDAFGRFCLPEVPAAAAQLTLDNGEVAITMTVPLGSSS